MLLKTLMPYLVIGTLLAAVFAGVSLSVKIDSSSPVVTITSPTSSQTYVTSDKTLTIGGMVTDDTGIGGMNWSNKNSGDSGSVSQLPSASGNWNINSIPLLEGPNVITIKAWDKAGNSNMKAIKVILDTGNPSCMILTPTNGPKMATSSSTVNMTGFSSDKYGVVSVKWYNTANLATGTAFGTGSWSITDLPLRAGYNDIQIKALDNAGNVGIAKINISYDFQIPDCDIILPTSASTYFTSWNVTGLSGTASDNLGVTKVMCTNAANGDERLANGTLNWNISMPLDVGANLITVTAYDASNNTKSDNITVTYDPTSPTLAITSPTASINYLTNASTVTLGGTASDNIAVTYINWTNKLSSSSGSVTVAASWSITAIPLSIGINHIVVMVTDAAGNSVQDFINVTRDSTKPICTITVPGGNKTYVATPTIDISGTATDAAGVVSVTWSSNRTGSGTATGTTSWSVLGINLDLGSNMLTVIAWDAAGNAGVQYLKVIRTA